MATRIRVWSGAVPGKQVITVDFDAPPIDPGCDGCSTPCCFLSPVLGYDEARSGRYRMAFSLTPPEGASLGSFVPPDGALFVTLARRSGDGGCAHLMADGRCEVYEHRPRACACYDCRSDPSPLMRKWAARRFHPEVVA